MIDWVGTGVFATPEEVAELNAAYERARNTPVISFGGPDMASVAFHQMIKRSHEMAIAHGLPEIEGYYGLDLDSMEFLKSSLN
jgi:hypothetical protein